MQFPFAYSKPNNKVERNWILHSRKCAS